MLKLLPLINIAVILCILILFNNCQDTFVLPSDTPDNRVTITAYYYGRPLVNFEINQRDITTSLTNPIVSTDIRVRNLGNEVIDTLAYTINFFRSKEKIYGNSYHSYPAYPRTIFTINADSSKVISKNDTTLPLMLDESLIEAVILSYKSKDNNPYAGIYEGNFAVYKDTTVENVRQINGEIAADGSVTFRLNATSAIKIIRGYITSDGEFFGDAYASDGQTALSKVRNKTGNKILISSDELTAKLKFDTNNNTDAYELIQLNLKRIK